MFLFSLVALALFFGGTAYLYVAMGPLEAKARKGVDRLYPKSALISRERGQLVGAWLAGAKRYEGASPVTIAVLYGMRFLVAFLLGLKVFLIFLK